MHYLATIVYPWRRETVESTALVRWCLHLALWTCLIAALWQINRAGGVERVLRSSWPILHGAWLPLLGLSIYVLGWLCRGLWLALRSDPLPSAFPEVESAWSASCAALEQANIPLRRTPVYLVLGSLDAEMDLFLQARGARPMAPKAAAPFHMFAEKNAIVIVASGVTRLGGASDAAGRLRHLCKLLRYGRGSAGPMQGIVLTIDCSASATETDIGQAVAAAQDDLRVVRKATGQEAPLFLVITGCDVQGVEDSEWIQRFPPHPDVDPAEIPAMFQTGMNWLCRQRIGADLRNRLTASEVALDDNLEIYHWMAALHQRRGRLGKMLVEATRTDESEPGLVAGCYFLSPGAGEALWQDLCEHRHTAHWTAGAVAEHARRRHWVWLGYGFATIGLGVILASVSWFLLAP